VSPLVIPIALEWVILVTTLAPVLLVGRFSKYPKLGLALWFIALLSSGIGALLALSVAVASVFSTYAKLSSSPLGSPDWQLALLLSFAPWLILAISGIALALINQRLEPLVSTAREVTPLLDAAMKPWMAFEGRQVLTVELPVYLAAAVRGRILISRVAAESLSENELEAVLWHELGHIRGRHNALRQLAALVRVLSPWLTATRALVHEVDRLIEIDADLYALRRVDSQLLRATRKKFISS
jgi:Zn-dependent protease with chaperone function